MPDAADAIMEKMNGKLSAPSLKTFLSERGELLLVLVVAVFAGMLRFYRIADKSIWLDEAFSLWIARHSIWEGWRWLIEVDQHPPFYYSLLHLWIELFGPLEGAVRTLSALASTLTVPVFTLGAAVYWIAQQQLLPWAFWQYRPSTCSSPRKRACTRCLRSKWRALSISWRGW